MPLNGSQPTATISFGGLMLFRFTPEKFLDIFILQCQRHKLVLDIQKIVAHDQDCRVTSERLDHQLNLRTDLFISDESSADVTIRPYEETSVKFEREKDLGHPQDSRWLIRLAGPQFDGGPLIFTPPAGIKYPKELRPTIRVKNGVLYTEKRTDEKFVSIPLNDADILPKLIGFAAFRMAVDITCAQPDGGVLLSNAQTPVIDPQAAPDCYQSKSLPRKDNTRYLINIENYCPHNHELSWGTDFRFYFDAVTTPNHKFFDIQQIVENKVCEPRRTSRSGPPEFSLDSGPQPCIPADGGP